jgi:DNA/RNA endonuclease G (NUC1)
MIGYNQNFFPRFRLPLPGLTEAQKKQRAPLKQDAEAFELKYTHFSIVLNKKRKFAFFAATNINGNSWNAAVKDRVDFTKDDQVLPAYQTGNELYDFLLSRTANDFDKGHIAKFQDPQWGKAETILQAANDTMKFTNCLPQHHTLNRGAWKSLEDYTLKKFTRKTGANGKKITVFAGPLLLTNDPFYIDRIAGKPFQIPCHFWKLIVYPNKQNKLSVAAFLMSQKNILFKHNFVVDSKQKIRSFTEEELKPEQDFFAGFTSGEPYQVRVDFIEKTTGFSFGLDNLYQPYTKTEATELIYKRVEVPLSREKFVKLQLKDSPLNFEFEGIQL